jgi:alkylation response protein AidB-like acyl-CoA dehydrogenase
MNFDFSEDQQSLRDAVRRWVDKGYDFERRKRIVAAGGHSAETWRELADLGLTGVAIPEAVGGLGFGPVDAMVVMEELGRGLVLAPYAQGALMSATAFSAAPSEAQETWLPRIAGGEALVVLAHQEREARYRLNHVTTTAVPAADGGDAAWTVSGAKSIVPAGDHADAFIVPARTAHDAHDATGIALFLVEREQPGVTTRGYPTQDGGRAPEVAFPDAAATLLVPAGQGFAVLEQMVDVGIAALAAEAVGVMDRLLAVTVEYMNTRKQFGVAIATFQALRHRIADVKMQVELARSMSYYASLKLGEPAAQRRRALSQAKVQLGQSMRFVGQQCIQLHGGIGVTDEYIAGHYFKRLTVMEMTYGDTLHHLGEVSARMGDTAGVFA